MSVAFLKDIENLFRLEERLKLADDIERQFPPGKRNCSSLYEDRIISYFRQKIAEKKQEPSNPLQDNQNVSKELATEKEIDELLLKLGPNGLDFSEIFANEPWLTSKNKRITAKKILSQESKNGVLEASQKKTYAHLKKHPLMSKLHQVLDDNPEARTTGDILRIFKKTLAEAGLSNPFKDDQIRYYLGHHCKDRIEKDPHQLYRRN